MRPSFTVAAGEKGPLREPPVPAHTLHYTVHRTAGAAEADTAIAQLRPLLTLDPATPERVMAAARIRAVHPLAYGDAFAVATAAAHDAILLTGDPELTSRSVSCRVEDLRR
jgi:predicted nucleic acid-binding protein